MILVLIGYMASGKSTFGKKIAKKVNYDFLDLDNFIEDKEKMSVSRIFKSKGEIYFRKKETEYLEELLNTKDNVVLSLGGGTPCFKNNMALILACNNAKSVYLKASISKLVTNLGKCENKRPLVAHIKTVDALTEFVAKHLFERTPYYSESEIQIVTDNKTKEEVVDEIILKLF